ncbi:protein of unknown function [Methylocaldum szegediense]|uniref:Uncharacterized protein n=1 Tax=Methylocaldum szegediense TaxID=73780 RepID=A0ABM9HX76_9GAMM|nr:protein of unknown function [Methylocaldum szegediense]
MQVVSLGRAHHFVKVFQELSQEKEIFPSPSVLMSAPNRTSGLGDAMHALQNFSCHDSGVFHYSLCFHSSKIRRRDH